MVFSSIAFLLAFLPITFVCERICKTIEAKNRVLIVASLLFYSYGEPVFVLLMVISTYLNYIFGELVSVDSGTRARGWMALSVVVNLGILGVFKYAAMTVTTANALLGLSLPIPNIPLPLGISFYTFQAMSYVIDVYRRNVQPQRRYTRVLLYVSLFPQLVAGPIVKYHDIEPQMESRSTSWLNTALGLRRFSLGLAKKVLIANILAGTADAMFALTGSALVAPSAWLGALVYVLQIYFDFSAYSDMAIGLGRMFGFAFQENFMHPYASLSVKEFWRRWHISLSSWLKEYLYIPLGGNRKGRSRAVVNRMVVFFLCGLWHGANWTFVVWGLLHGIVLLLEEVAPIRRLPRALGHVYTMLFVTVTFVVFRCDTLGQAWSFLTAMFLRWKMNTIATALLAEQLRPLVIITTVVAICLSGSLPQKTSRFVEALANDRTRPLLRVFSYAFCTMLLAVCVSALAEGSYNPFIYFRF